MVKSAFCTCLKCECACIDVAGITRAATKRPARPLRRVASRLGRGRVAHGDRA